MPDIRRVIWSKESSRRIQSIKQYLYESWSEDEVESFLNKLAKFENLVVRFPKLYPTSVTFPELRKAPISKYQSVIYEIDGNIVRVHTILDHRQQK